MAIFPTLFLGNIGRENVFYDILQRKSYWHFSKGVNPWFWSKNSHFSNFFFLGTIGQENAFYDILERKNAFPRYKNKKLKMSRN